MSQGLSVTSSINFPCKVCEKMLMIMIKLFNVNFATIGFTLIAITLIILTINSFKIPMILGIVFCCSHIFPFKSMNKGKNFSICVSNFRNNNKPGKTINNEASLLLKPSEKLKLLVNQFNNNPSPEDNTDTENVGQSKCYDIDEL